MNTTKTRNAKSARQTRLASPRQTRAQFIHIEFTGSPAERVAIAGSFNDWRPEATPMIEAGEGRWIKDLALPPGTYEYCLVVDGDKWMPDPQARETKPNPFGGCNSVLKVPSDS